MGIEKHAAAGITTRTGAESSEQSADTKAGNRAAFDPLSIISEFDEQNCWTPAAHEYVNTIRKSLTDDGRTLNVTAKFCGNNAMVFMTTWHAVLLIIESGGVSTYDLQNETSIASAISSFNEMNVEVMVDKKVTQPQRKLLNVVTANAKMFDRVGQMTTYIDLALKAATGSWADAIRLEDFYSSRNDAGKNHRPGRKLFVDINAERMRSFMDARSPLATNVRDFGFVCYISDSHTPHGQEPKRKPFFGVSAYVEFLREYQQNSNIPVFKPVVHVTEIITTMPTQQVLGIVIPLVAEVLIGKEIWKSKFTDLTNGSENLGNLIIDAESGAPMVAKDERDLDTIYQAYLLRNVQGNVSAQLVFDYMVGGPNIPGLEKLCKTDQSELFNSLAQFYGSSTAPSGSLTTAISQEITGIAEVNNKLSASAMTDVRQFTYLYCVANASQYDEKFSQLLYRFPDAIARFEMYRKDIVGEVIPTHKIVNLIANGKIAEEMAAIVASPQMSIEIPIDSQVQSITFGSDAMAYSSRFTSGNTHRDGVNITNF